MTKTEIEFETKKAYEKGKADAMRMKLDADGCVSCAFEETEPWEMPCAKCARNSKDYWRAKNNRRIE